MTTFPIDPAPAAQPVDDGGLLRGALGLALVAMAGAGVVYPMLGVGLGQLLFAHGANGSLIERDGRVLGSSLVAQPFAADGYVQPRPSAADYDVMAVSGSNEARSNPELRARIDAARATVAQRERVSPDAVPGDLLTQSGGGIDPHISPEAAAIQIARVASARGLDAAVVRAEVEAHVEPRQFGVLGQPRVNVLQLNLALDALGAGRGDAVRGR
ncbi:potassium-transporting ATPase subunit KdpC [Luteimonas sp BLCC-B24]|uniref:potassium-transporting ATPase subunit KdpC n=1 Tax=Luteimonas sp. BLCC-B24 TaxID=3025317 RepID=UPI00234D4F12|nr:potassium-transporting ATPase subunit KdpC [Luteimonas sp. BLCC-B24]MDC7806133.1 potassium-transporting ATPase subunit KdpC [Luteimonas sp. BLCC-B24]